MTTEQQGPKVQKMKTQAQHLYAQKQRKETTYLQKASGTQWSPAKSTNLPCQPLNELWETVAPGPTPSNHSVALHAPELPCIGPAFPPGPQLLV